MFKPVNRFILLETAEEEDLDSLVILPDNYQPKNQAHMVATVLATADDIKFNLPKNTKIVVDRSMIEEICIGPTIYNIILENYIFGILE